ncbi:MAG: hypothetical protein HYX53_05265 [Chloroflexi bacterium]|nr:hypothetical protein [Chloroflexota bacterium]
MNREQKIAALLERKAEDERRLALDEIDRVARETSTFGSKEHRDRRDKVEKQYDDARRLLEGLSDDQLDRALSTPVQ